MRISDWSSDVCSSDLPYRRLERARDRAARRRQDHPPERELHRPGRPRLRADQQALIRRSGLRRRRPSAPGARCFRMLAVLQSEGAKKAAQKRGLFVTRRTGISAWRSEEHTSELQSLMRISYAVFCLKKKKKEQKINMM